MYLNKQKIIIKNTMSTQTTLEKLVNLPTDAKNNVFGSAYGFCLGTAIGLNGYFLTQSNQQSFNNLTDITEYFLEACLIGGLTLNITTYLADKNNVSPTIQKLKDKGNFIFASATSVGIAHLATLYLAKYI